MSHIVVTPISNEAGLTATLEKVDALMMLGESRTQKQSDELDILALMVEDYEGRVHPVSPPHPVDTILFHMDQRSLEPGDLVAALGSLDVVQDVLQRRRAPSMRMIGRLARLLELPLERLVGEYVLAA